MRDPGEWPVAEMFEQASFASLESLSSTRPDYAHANDADVMGMFVRVGRTQGYIQRHFGWAMPRATSGLASCQPKPERIGKHLLPAILRTGRYGDGQALSINVGAGTILGG